MSIFLEDLKNLTMYKRPFNIPVNDKHRRLGSAIFLMTPNYKSSIDTIQSPLIINKKLFESYYTEKNINFFINQENNLVYFDSNTKSINEVASGDFKVKSNDTVVFEQDFIQTPDMISYMDYYNEDAIFNPALKRILYEERLKNNKDVYTIYAKLKTDCPIIKKTFIDYKMYKKNNIFIDWSYYTETFFRNNYFIKDKGLNLFMDFMSRFLEDPRLADNGYVKKTILIPVKDWADPNYDITDYNKTINPISLIYRTIKTHPEKLNAWYGHDFVFLGSNSYFKLDFKDLNRDNLQRFLNCVNKIISNEPIEDPIEIRGVDSKKGIISDIADKIEDSQGIQINNLTGSTLSTADEIENKINTAEFKSDENKKDEIVDIIAKAADNVSTVDDAIDNLEDDDVFIKNLLMDLAEDEDTKVKMNATRSSRMIKLQSDIQDKKIKNTTIKNMLDEKQDAKIESVKLPIDSIDDSWKDMKFMNFDKTYDIDTDIVKCIMSLADEKKERPIGIISIDVEDSSTTEDFKETYTVQCEDTYGQRFKLVFDIPRLIDYRFMKLGGNEKIISGQLMLLPIVKTDEDTCQIVSNYNKIFISRFGVTSGKSFIIADRIIKTMAKLDDKNSNIKYTKGDNSKISSKYELPIDYIDLASVFSKIEVKNSKTDNYTIYFNQEEIREKYDVKDSEGLPAIVMHTGKEDKLIYWNTDICQTFSGFLITILTTASEEFYDKYAASSVASRYTYSKASILNTEIPIIVICGYNEGLVSTLKKANIKYDLVEKKPHLMKDLQDFIKFSDGYLIYDLSYASSLLLNGLKECSTESYSLKDINSKLMWAEFLDIFGGRIKADGLDNFKDLMMDPITTVICDKYSLPADYIEALLYANELLSDNKYNRHVDITGNRYRTNEIIAGYTYRALAEAYGVYRNFNKRGKKTPMTIKKSIVIDYLMMDPTETDFSTIQPLLEIESKNAVSFKGLSGMNSDRSYSLDKRTFDSTMINNIAMSTGFAGNVGITRQMTIDSNIEDARGAIKITKNLDSMGTTKTLCMTEALTPFGVTRDDPFRTAMEFIQTAKHSMRVEASDPLLVTNGSDYALPYLTSDAFSFKAKGKGVIKEITGDYMIIEYDKSINSFGKTSEVVNLAEQIKKNSDGGFFVTLKLDPAKSLKVGSIVRENDIVAYDKLSYNDSVGPNKDIAYSLGVLAKVAILTTDEGYEDSAIISEKLSKKMSADVVLQKPVMLDKNSNVYNIIKKGTSVQEGDQLMVFQNAFEDEDMNALLRNITGDEDDLVSDLGRKPIKSKVTGVITDIKIYRTAELDDLSPSLKKLVGDYEFNIRKMKKIMDKYDKDAIHNLPPDYALPLTGKLKNSEGKVLIEFYEKYKDRMSVGDKLIYYSAVKGVVKDIFPSGLEPYSEFRKDETIDALLSVGSVNARMVGSVLSVTALNKIMIELSRKCRDIMGIDYDMNL